MKNIFVHTQNAKTFISTMKEAENANEPQLLAFYGQAGRGKTNSARFFSAQEGWTFTTALRGWTDLWMLQDLCFELHIDPVPKRKKPCFEAIIKKLLESPRPVLIDEADKLNEDLLEWVRDLADKTYVPFALVGEKLLLHKMEKERRIWSRTLRIVEFEAISTKDILFFSKEAANLNLTANQAELLRTASDGDFRLVGRDVRRLESIMLANNSKTVSDEMVNLAIKQGLKGK